MGSDEDVLVHTLFICRQVQVYRIPPRPHAGGYRSGDWLVSDKIFDGRLRVVGKGEICEVQIEDTNSGELFATCPIPPGKRDICVEPVTDSSRYFVLRVEDHGTGRHAFLGMGFTERGDAFDFNVALSDFDKQILREKASASLQSEGQSGSSTAVTDAAVATLYKEHGDLSLKEGQTIKINVKKPGANKPEMHLAGAQLLVPLPPPPGATPRLIPPPGGHAAIPAARIPTPAAPPASTPHTSQSTPPAAPQGDLLGFDDIAATTAKLQQISLTQSSPAPSSTSSAHPGWAVFD